MTGLTVLCLDRNRISDIRPVSGMKMLEQLHLKGNQVRNIESLAPLTNLMLINLRNNQITDVKPLSGLITGSVKYFPFWL
ncbi:leucine-rich repeat domain-containing protein [Chloroflexota bacterium]